MNWTRHGDCNHCGHCCTMIARTALVRTPAEIERDRPFYLTRGFKPMDVDGEVKYVLWTWMQAPCPEYVGQRCGVHAMKPETCVTFPRLPADIVGTPCSYWFENADGNCVGGTGSPHPASETDLLKLETVAEAQETDG